MAEVQIEATLTQGPVSRRLAELALPMMGGILGAYGFNLADTYFVALLGERELAAMSFTFPVIMVLVGVAFGMNTGTTAVVARYIGQHHPEAVRRIATDSLVLAFLAVLFFAAVGMRTIDPLFTLLGAPPDILPLIRDYMLIWHPGMVAEFEQRQCRVFEGTGENPGRALSKYDPQDRRPVCPALSERHLVVRG